MLTIYIQIGIPQKYAFVNTAGHSSSDEGIVDNLLKGLRKLTDQI